MSSYAFLVQTCREEHKKKHPDASVNFSAFSKKCSVRWKTMSPKEKGKFEVTAKADKARYDREMKTYISPTHKGETKKKFTDPNAPKRPPSVFLICSEHCPKIKGEHSGLSIGDAVKKLGEMWNSTAADDKQPYEKAAGLKEKYERDIAAYRANGKPDAVRKGVVKAEKGKKKKEEEDEDEDEEDEEEEEEEEDEDEENDDDE